jgi:hypothetical protein
MIASSDALSAIAAARIGADVNGSLGIHGNANHSFALISNAIGCMDVFKDLIGLGYFFLGLILVTFFN